MSDQLTALDATFLELEEAEASAHMHIGGVLVFDPLPGGGAPTLAELQAHVVDRLDLLPRYRQRLSKPHTGGLAWPVWEDDESFDIAVHVRRAALPAPPGEKELLDWVGEFFSSRLDRDRPLWEMVLLEGLAGGRWALSWKTHHCLVDGVGAVDIASVLLDAEPHPAGSSWAKGPRDRQSFPGVWDELLPHPPETLRQAVNAALSAVRAGVGAALHPREAVGRSAALASLIARDELVAAPGCSLNVPIRGKRRMAVVRAGLDVLKAIKQSLGGTVNDVVLAAATGGLRRLLLERGESPPCRGLRAMVPVNVRSGDAEDKLGNRIVSLFIELPVDESEPLRRYQRVVQETRRQKEGSQGSGASALLGVSELLPPVLHATLSRSLFATRLFNVTITNVAGPAQPHYAMGAEMKEVIPLVPLAAEHALGIAVVSYAGGLVFGLNADHDAVPDLDVLAGGIRDEIATLRRVSDVGT